LTSERPLPEDFVQHWASETRTDVKDKEENYLFFSFHK
jgi:hypothetical protein